MYDYNTQLWHYLYLIDSCSWIIYILFYAFNTVYPNELLYIHIYQRVDVDIVLHLIILLVFIYKLYR